MYLGGTRLTKYNDISSNSTNIFDDLKISPSLLRLQDFPRRKENGDSPRRLLNSLAAGTAGCRPVRGCRATAKRVYYRRGYHQGAMDCG